MDKIRYFCDTCGDEIEDIGSAITVPCGCGCSDRFCNQECMERFEGHEQDDEELDQTDIYNEDDPRLTDR